MFKFFKQKKQATTRNQLNQVDEANVHLLTAQDLSMVVCHSCGLLNSISPVLMAAHHQMCSRCRSVLHIRKPVSLERTWALMLSAAIMYIPANLLPMTITTSLMGDQQDTIMSGVIYFWQNQDYLVASVIFTASIFIPMLKLMILIFLLLVVRKQSTDQQRWRPEQCAFLYRVVEFVGRWSMIDVFVVSLLTALIQMRALASISAGPGAVAFGAVVVLTMFASLSFDPRMIWDNYYKKSVPQSNSPSNTSSNDRQG